MVRDLESEVWVTVARQLSEAYKRFDSEGYEAKVILNQNNANPVIGQLNVIYEQGWCDQIFSISVSNYNNDTLQVTIDMVGDYIASAVLIPQSTPDLQSELSNIIGRFSTGILERYQSAQSDEFEHSTTLIAV